MHRKIISGIACLVFILSSMPVSGSITANAMNLESPAPVNATATLDDLDYLYDGTCVEIKSCNNSATGEMVIPEMINGVPVTSIENTAFEDCSFLTSVIIPSTVTRIELYAFSGCSSLKSITIQNPNCKIIDDENTISSTATIYGYPGSTAQAYAGKYNRKFAPLEYLKYTKYSDHVEITGCDQSAKGKIIIPDTIEGLAVTSIGRDAFYKCSALTSITIPDSVKSIGEDAFASCSALESITIPDSVTSIEREAFGNCSALESITIPDSVTSIERSAFAFCSALTSITIPDSVTSIEFATFYGCSSLTSVTISDHVTSIGELAFCNCSALESITIPDSVTSIEREAFSECSSLKSITIQNPNCKIVYNNTISSTATIYGYPGSTAQAYAEAYNQKFELLECIGYMEYSDHVEIIESFVKGEISIPEKINGLPVTSIEENAFLGCSSLTSVVIPGSVTSIGAKAFEGCSSLQSVTISYLVKNIGTRAFYGCSALKSINIPSNLTSIEEFVFYGCSSLTSVTVPDNITSIGNYAFYGCSNLSSITIKNKNCKIYDYKDTISTTVTIYGYPGSTAQAYAEKYNRKFAPLEYLKYTKYSDHVELTECDNSTEGEIAIPSTFEGLPVTSIGEGAFLCCSSLTSIIIPNSVTNIGEGAFDACSSLESVTIPASVTSIGEKAFYSCLSLESVTIQNPDCEIYDHENTISNNTTIYGYPDSTAQVYAEKYSKKFSALDENQEITTPTEPSTTEPVVTDVYDLNRDGSVNAMDAAIILQYAAETGSGKFNGTVTDFLKAQGYIS